MHNRTGEREKEGMSLKKKKSSIVERLWSRFEAGEKKKEKKNRRGRSKALRDGEIA